MELCQRCKKRKGEIYEVDPYLDMFYHKKKEKCFWWCARCFFDALDRCYEWSLVCLGKDPKEVEKEYYALSKD
jgi:hypothetical protein